jgi:hypothetical protein
MQFRLSLLYTQWPRRFWLNYDWASLIRNNPFNVVFDELFEAPNVLFVLRFNIIAEGTQPLVILRRRLRTPDCRMHSPPFFLARQGSRIFWQTGATLEVAQRIAGHADSRTTKLCDRREQKVLFEDMERIRY